MRLILALFALVSVPGVCRAADRVVQGFPAGSAAILVQASGDDVLVFDEAHNASYVTNGRALTIAASTVRLVGDVRFMSFNPGSVAPPLAANRAVAAAGPNGGPMGPGSAGGYAPPCPTGFPTATYRMVDGCPGQAGGHGQPGNPGTGGRDASLFELRIGIIEGTGTLTVANVGQRGGRGGSGGRGGNGGPGGDGARRTCSSTAGNGGDGGPGGFGGAPGLGGKGGNGGEIQITPALAEKLDSGVTLYVDGGPPGQAGLAGARGDSGAPGAAGGGNACGGGGGPGGVVSIPQPTIVVPVGEPGADGLVSCPGCSDAQLTTARVHVGTPGCDGCASAKPYSALPLDSSNHYRARIVHEIRSGQIVPLRRLITSFVDSGGNIEAAIGLLYSPPTQGGSPILDPNATRTIRFTGVQTTSVPLFSTSSPERLMALNLQTKPVSGTSEEAFFILHTDEISLTRAKLLICITRTTCGL